MENFRDGAIGFLAMLLSAVVLVWMVSPEIFGQHLERVDNGRFINMEQDNGPILD